MDRNETELIMLLAAAGPCSLDSSPKKNWVEKSGGLPNYICHVAKGIMKSGHSKGQAIAMAVGTVKRWAHAGTTNGRGGKQVNADTIAKAAAAVAEWEALKAKNAARHLVKASRENGTAYIMLTDVGSFSTEMVRNAWYALENRRARAEEMEHRLQGLPVDHGMHTPVARGYIRELWTDFIIVDYEEAGEGRYKKIPYTVSGADVEFGEGTEVVQEWADAPESENDDLSEEEQALIDEILDVTKEDPSMAARVRAAVSQG